MLYERIKHNLVEKDLKKMDEDFSKLSKLENWLLAFCGYGNSLKPL